MCFSHLRKTVDFFCCYNYSKKNIIVNSNPVKYLSNRKHKKRAPSNALHQINRQLLSRPILSVLCVNLALDPAAYPDFITNIQAAHIFRRGVSEYIQEESFAVAVVLTM